LATMLPFFLLFVAVTPNLVPDDIFLSFALAGLTAIFHILSSLPQAAFIKKDLALAQLRQSQTRLARVAADANQGVRPARPKESDDLRKTMAAIARMELKSKQDLEYQQAMFTDADVEQGAVAVKPQPTPEPSPVVQVAAQPQITALPSDALSREAVLESKKIRLGDEPSATLKEGVVNIQVRFPSGKVLRRRFLTSDLLQALFDGIDTFVPEGIQGTSGEDISSCYEIQCSFPKLILDPMLSSLPSSHMSTFQSVGLLASHSFFVKEKLVEDAGVQEN